MTYLQLMIKGLEFFKNQEEKFDSDDFYYFWLGNGDEDVDSYYKSKAKEAIMYLLLLETKNSGDVNIPLLNVLEKRLSYFCPSLCKTLEQAHEKTVESIKEDPYMLDQVCLLKTDELTENEQIEIIKDLSSEFEEQLSSNDWVIQQTESAIHTVMEMFSQTLPELFFSEKGYKYIDKEYQIDDSEFRQICYEYLKENIRYYNSSRIYKVDENIYSEIYDVEEDEFDDCTDDVEEDEDIFESEDIFLDFDELRGVFDVFEEEIDNYDILYYSVTLLVIMLRFIKNKQYDKIKRMIEIDDIITDTYDDRLETEKTLIEALYQPKTMEKDYHRKISIPKKSDFYLDFFLSNNEFTQQYNIQQLSLIITHCFDFFDLEPLNKMIKNSDVINSIFTNNNLDNQEEKVKKLIKIRREDS